MIFSIEQSSVNSDSNDCSNPKLNLTLLLERDSWASKHRVLLYYSVYTDPGKTFAPIISSCSVIHVFEHIIFCHICLGGI